MKAKRATAIILAAAALFILNGCGEEKPMPSVTPSIAPAPAASASAMPSPTETVTDVPAYAQAGLPAFSQMSELEKYYYYSEPLPDSLEDGKANIEFSEETDADLDGDGKDEPIILEPGEPFPDFEDVYQSVTVDIAGKKLKLTAGAPEDGYDLSGIILDIDKGDGKKELEILAGETSTILGYDKGKITTLHEEKAGAVYADGTGYIFSYGSVKIGGDAVEAVNLLKLRGDHSGFDGVEMRFIPLAPGEGARAQWDEKLAGTPGGAEDITISKGTEVFLGLYDKGGWVQLMNKAEGQIGWLDGKRVKLHDFTGGVFKHQDVGE